MGRIYRQREWSNLTVKKPLLLLVLSCLLALPMVSLVGCAGQPSSEPTGVQSSDDSVDTSEDYVAGEEALGKE